MMLKFSTEIFQNPVLDLKKIPTGIGVGNPGPDFGTDKSWDLKKAGIPRSRTILLGSLQVRHKLSYEVIVRS